jgi:hypothetical protein
LWHFEQNYKKVQENVLFYQFTVPEKARATAPLPGQQKIAKKPGHRARALPGQETLAMSITS